MTHALRRAATLALLPLLLAAAVASGDDAPPELELRVKAAFLFNFAKFTTWPADKLAVDAPLHLCVQDSTAMAGVLAETVRGRAVGGHAIEVRHAARADDLRTCHIVYVGADDDDAVAAELATLAGHRVLSVHEAAAPHPDGVIRFFLSDGGRVRFEVNVTAASREQVTLSAKLLEVSQVVTR